MSLRMIALALVAAVSVGCGAADDVARNADDIAALIAKQAGKAATAEDDIARMLRGLSKTEDGAIRLGQGLTGSTFSTATATSRIRSAIGSATSRLSAEGEESVAQVTLSVMCDGLDAYVAGKPFDAGEAVIKGIGGLSDAVDRQLLKQQVESMMQDATGGESGEVTSTRLSLLMACIVLSPS